MSKNNSEQSPTGHRSRRSRTIAGVSALVGLVALTACEAANEGTPLTPGVTGGVQFGSTVAMSANGLRLAVGMPLDGPDARIAAGSVKVYSRTASDLAWTLEETLNEPSQGARFGSSLDFSADGQLLAIGAPLDDTDDGRAYVYERGDGEWEENILIRPPVANKDERHGQAVALGLSSTTPVLAVGVPRAVKSGLVAAGAVRVYTLDLAGNKATLRATVNSNAASSNNNFGHAVDMADSHLVVGEPGAPLRTQQNVGAAHVFTKNTGAWTWSHAGQIQSRIGITDQYVIDDGSEMGSSVAISGDKSTIAVGSPEYADGKGAVVVAKLNASGSYDSVRRFHDSTGGYVGNVGESVALDRTGSALLIGAPEFANYQGLYGLFDLTNQNNEAAFAGQGLSAETYGRQYFGYSVAMGSSGKIFAIGAPVASSSNGMVRTFDTFVKPGAPTNVRTSAGDGGALVVWAAPSGTTSDLANTYTVTASPGGQTCTSAGLACIVRGLTNGTAYTFTVVATNAKGVGPASSASTAVTPLAGLVGNLGDASIIGEGGLVIPQGGGGAGFGSVPGAPTKVKAVGGRRKVTISWIAPVNNGGQAIQAYQVTALPSGRKCVAVDSTSCTIAKLGDNTAHTFEVVAVNINGASVAAKKNAKTWTQPRVSTTKAGSAKDIARFAGLKTPKGARYSVALVGKNSPQFCTIASKSVKAKSAGSCRVRVSVTTNGVTTSKNVELRTSR